MARDYSHRLGKKTVRVVRTDGTPVAGQTIRAEMQNHEFLFGAGLFDIIPYAANEMTDPAARALFEKKLEKFTALLNNTTLPFYWTTFETIPQAAFEPVEGKPRHAQVMAAARLLQQNHVTIKGHPLCWHSACGSWMLKYPQEEILRRQLARVRREVEYFRGVIDMWDVINEPVIMPIYDRYENGITPLGRKYGRVKTIQMMFDAAREASPDATLLINDFNLSTNYQILIDGCLHAGVPIDEIGLQTHMYQGYRGEEFFQSILERYEVFGKPLHFSEISLVSGHIMPPEIVDLNDYQIPEWPTTPEGEDRQAREYVDLMEILFAHPLVRTAYTWDFCDGGWLGAPSGFVRADGSTKPVYDALYELIKRRWWTNTEVVTDKNGEAVIEGYRGDYKLTCCGTETELALRRGQLDGVKTIIL